MSHNITKHDHVFTPENNLEFSGTWHGLHKHPAESPEVILPDGSNVPEVFRPIIECGFKPDIDGQIAPMDEETASELGAADFSKWKVLLADLRENGGEFMPIHVHGKGYRVHQNKDLFDASIAALNEVLGEGQFEIATIGTLGSYSQFFLSIAIAGQSEVEIVGDKHRQFFNLNTSHNGLIGSSFMLSMIRIVCMNTVQFSIEDAERSGTRSKIKHTQNSVDAVNARSIEKQVKAWLESAAAHKRFLENCKRQSMNSNEFQAFAAGVLTNESTDALSTVSFNRIKVMEEIFRGGIGEGNKGESRYDAFQAFTEFFTHRINESSEKGKRVATANFGRGNEWKIEAMRVLSDDKSFTKATGRGEILMNDAHSLKGLSIAG